MYTLGIQLDKYGVILHTTSNSIGLKGKFGGKEQWIVFGNRQLSEKALRSIADECLWELDCGDTEEAVAQCAKDQLPASVS